MSLPDPDALFVSEASAPTPSIQQTAKPAQNLKRKAPYDVPDDDKAPPAKRPVLKGKGKASTPIPNNDEEDAILETVPFQYASNPTEWLPKSKVLSIVRARGIKVFKREAATTLNDKDEEALQDCATVLKVESKAVILSRYYSSWKQRLAKCEKVRRNDVADYERRAQEHEWEKEFVSYNKEYVEPKKQLLRAAEDDVKMMAALIKLLEDN